jgi:hypothetical protein
MGLDLRLMLACGRLMTFAASLQALVLAAAKSSCKDCVSETLKNSAGLRDQGPAT